MSEEKSQEAVIAKENSGSKIGTQKDKWKKIKEKFHLVGAGSEDLSIHRVPNKLRKFKEDAYSPRVVSIGPFHRDNQDLAAMREHKWRYMLHFLQQVKDPTEYHICLEECTNAMYDSIGKVRASYAENIKYNNDDLVEIMLLDGCFILELFRRYDQLLGMNLEDQSDAIFNNVWMIPALQHDLALLENQIPFFILRKLYESVTPYAIKCNCKPPDSITSLALKFFQIKQKPTKEESGIEYKHLLDLLHKVYLPSNSAFRHPTYQISVKVPSESMSCENQQTSAIPKPASGAPPKQVHQNKKIWGFKFCATQLLEAGVDFKTGSAEDNLLHITFDDGVITIPQLNIDENTFSLIRNMIAFEQCSLRNIHHVTSYVMLMKSLIRSYRDFTQLEKKGIINRGWIRYQECLTQFKSIADQIVVKDFSFVVLCDQVHAYLNSSHWKKVKVSWKVRFNKNTRSVYLKYFSTPWSIISFLAALVLFILTAVQTYYSIHPR